MQLAWQQYGATSSKVCTFWEAHKFCETIAIFALVFMLTIQFQQERCLFVTEATQFCITADSTLIFKSVQLRKLGQSSMNRKDVHKKIAFHRISFTACHKYYKIWLQSQWRTISKVNIEWKQQLLNIIDLL